MKRWLVLFLLLMLAGTICLYRSTSAESNNAREVFWEKFKAAVVKGDKETVAALSQFPIAMPYGIRDIKNKAQLMKRYRELFHGEANAAKCFPAAKPYFDPAQPKEFSVACGFAKNGEGAGEPLMYLFSLTRKGWRFTGFDNVNE
jgi:hypothetical protein